VAAGLFTGEVAWSMVHWVFHKTS